MLKQQLYQLSVTAFTVLDTSNPDKNLSVVSLVILFLRSLETTSPIGDLLANEVVGCGLSFTLSLSILDKINNILIILKTSKFT